MGLSVAQRDLSNRYFIIAITMILIFGLMYLLTSKIEQEVVNAEQKQFDFRLAEIESAVRLQEAVLVARDQMDQADQYEGMNPMLWMKESTQYYLGEMAIASVTGNEGNWVYDPEKKVIAYKARTQEFLANNGKTESKWLQFKVVALWSNKGNSNKYEIYDQGSFNGSSGIKQGLVAMGLRLQRVN